MKKSLKEIWNNRNQILEGITNAIIRDEYVEVLMLSKILFGIV
jgi:hypothetical protein